jgi:Zn-dependent protease
VDRTTIVSFVCLVAAIILHEVSHGVVALWFGDDTAKRAGRITLNPVPHIDPFGSIIIPALGALSGLPVIGWAKPVPVNPARMRDGRRHMLWVGLAGPATNFGLMLLAAFGARSALAREGPVFSADDVSLLTLVLFYFAFVNLALGLFNLLPIPPLDGSHLLARIIPERHLATYYRLAPYGILVLFLLVFATDLTARFFDPFYEELADFIRS